MKKEEVYCLTVEGLIGNEEVINRLELYLRRFYSKDGGSPAIVLNLETGKFEFATLKKIRPTRPKSHSVKKLSKKEKA